MTATRTSPKPGRTLHINWSATPFDTTVVSLAVTEKGRTDAYHVFHEADSCEVEWVHDDDTSRRYVVTCSASGTGATWCTCPARVRCRHMSGTEVLIRRGELAMPKVGGDAGREWDERETAAEVMEAMAGL